MNTEDIARRAHGIWEMAGRPQGKAVDHWLQAEVELTEPMTQDPLVEIEASAQTRKRQPSRKAKVSPARRPNRQAEGEY
jgi:hypothetical protein